MAGQGGLDSIPPSFYRGADAVLLCFDLTNKSTFEELGQLHGDLLRLAGHREVGLPCVVVGTKADLELQRAVPRGKAETWSGDGSMPYLETSAKEASNVAAAFQTVAGLLQSPGSVQQGTHDTTTAPSAPPAATTAK